MQRSKLHDLPRRRALLAVRAAMKAGSLTTSELATRMRVSIPTAKRWLRGEGLSLENWLGLVSAVGLTLADVASAFDAAEARQFRYTDSQERELAEHPGLLAYFDQLLAGRSPAQIQSSCGLTPAVTSSYLKKLDRIGLIEWRDGTRVRVKPTGEPSWAPGGPLARKFRAAIVQEFIEGNRLQPKRLQMGLYRLTEKDREEVNAALMGAVSIARAADARNRMLAHSIELDFRLKQHGLIAGLSPFEPSVLTEIPNRRVLG